jgi:hypothetical protein
MGEATYLGQGYGTQIMQLLLARCFIHPQVQAVLVAPLDSNTRAHRFYQRLGFVPPEHRYFGPSPPSRALKLAAKSLNPRLWAIKTKIPSPALRDRSYLVPASPESRLKLGLIPGANLHSGLALR